MYYLNYKITNLINGKIYEGAHKTSNINDDYMGSGKLIIKAIEKYGIENFKKEVTFQVATEDIMYWIERMIVTKETVEDKNSYNLVIGGKGGWSHITTDMRINQNKSKIGFKHSKESKCKMSKSSKGKSKSIEHCKNISLSQKGKKLSEEHKTKIGNFHRGKIISNIAKDRLSKSITGINNYQTRTILVFDSNNNLLYESTASFKKFCLENNLPNGMLSYSIRNNGIRIYKNDKTSKFHNWFAIKSA